MNVVSLNNVSLDGNVIRKGASGGGGNVSPMLCSYLVESVEGNTINLHNYTYNGQTMHYREGAIISVSNHLSEAVSFRDVNLVLDGNEYEYSGDGFDLPSGKSVLFGLGPDPGVLYLLAKPSSSDSNNPSSTDGSSVYVLELDEEIPLVEEAGQPLALTSEQITKIQSADIVVISDPSKKMTCMGKMTMYGSMDLFVARLEMGGEALLFALMINNGQALYSISFDKRIYNGIVSKAGNASNFCKCYTSANTAAKTASNSDFELIADAQVRVKFQYANTASEPTLNIQSTGAKSMQYKGNLITNENFTFNIDCIYTFTYDGTYWVLEGDWDEAPTKLSQLEQDINISAEPEVKLIALSNNLNAEDFTFTAEECNNIVSAYYAYKVILFKKSTLQWATGWVVPNITISNQDSTYTMYMSYYVGSIYVELTSTFDSTNYTVTTIINKRVDFSTLGKKLTLEDTSITLEDNVMPNNVYVIPNAISSLDVNISTPLDEVASMEYTIHFAVGDTVGTFSFPDNLLWANGTAPTIEASTAYELSIVASSIGGGYMYKGVLTAFK